MPDFSDRNWAVVLALLWLCLTLPALGMVPLFDYDETIYAQTAIDMMHLGQWIVPTANGMDFFEKPPFTYYLMDGAFAVFGENAFAARLPSAVFTLFTAYLLFRFGEHRGDSRMGLIAALIFLSMFEVGLLAHAAILDAVLNFFIVAALLYYLRWLSNASMRNALICAAMMGFAVAIKGPVGVAVPIMIMVIDRLLVGALWHTLKRIPWFAALPLFVVCASPWYAMVFWLHGTAFLYEFIWVQNIGRALHPMQGHGGSWHYYFVVFMVSSLPWLLWLPWLFRQLNLRSTAIDLHTIRFAIVWLISVIVLFSFAQTKLPHYISCVYPALALALAVAWRRKTPSLPPYIGYGTAVLLMPLAVLLLVFPWLYTRLADYIHHPRALAILEQNITPSVAISIAGAVLLGILCWLIYTNKKQHIGVFIALGLVLQSALMWPLASFAGRLIQAPTMHAATLIRAMPANVRVFSYNLNTPSVSFYAGRNYHIILGKEGQQTWANAASPKVLFMRMESKKDFPLLHNNQLLLDQGGYLMFQGDQLR
ncbi:MAG: glycosyltransferase family 39 protein [Mariprofundaceae bacterium]|nr:glycosyltransferase family 39 protein [Mariprofundaceae bacterium]